MGKCLSKFFGCFHADDDVPLMPDTIIMSDDTRNSTISAHTFNENELEDANDAQAKELALPDFKPLTPRQFTPQNTSTTAKPSIPSLGNLPSTNDTTKQTTTPTQPSAKPSIPSLGNLSNANNSQSTQTPTKPAIPSLGNLSNATAQPQAKPAIPSLGNLSHTTAQPQSKPIIPSLGNLSIANNDDSTNNNKPTKPSIPSFQNLSNQSSQQNDSNSSNTTAKQTVPAINKPLIPALGNTESNGKIPRLGMAMPIDLSGVVTAETEETRRQAKLDRYTRECSQVTPYMYLSADAVARDLATLESCGITHVLNTASMVCENYFKESGKFEYMSLYLVDGPSENLDSVLYDVLEFMDKATNCARTVESDKPGTVLVHCWQGVSRSSTMCVLYLMYINGWDYETAFQHVRNARPIARPNTGFMCQLLAWHKRRTQGITEPRLYLITSQSTYAPKYLVAKPHPQSQFSSSVLDPCSCCVLHALDCVYVWAGAECGAKNLETAKRHVGRLQKFEHAPEKVVTLQQGSETQEFWALFQGGETGFASVLTARQTAISQQQQPVQTPRGNRSQNPSQPANSNNNDEPVAPTRTLNPRMFAHPDWEEIEMFDSDDLVPEGVFVVVPDVDGEHTTQYAYIWIGDDAEIDSDDGMNLARECLEQVHVGVTGDIVVVLDGQEDARFWKMFPNG